MQRNLIFIVSLRDYPPEAVFSTLDAAKKWAAEKGLDDNYVLGPYVVDDPDANEPNWFEAEDA